MYCCFLPKSSVLIPQTFLIPYLPSFPVGNTIFSANFWGLSRRDQKDFLVSLLFHNSHGGPYSLIFPFPRRNQPSWIRSVQIDFVFSLSFSLKHIKSKETFWQKNGQLLTWEASCWGSQACVLFLGCSSFSSEVLWLLCQFSFNLLLRLRSY